MISAILISGIFFAQNTNIKLNYSTTELTKIQKTIPENQKHEIYKHYLRAEIFEDMKREFKFKKYSDEILKKFTDSVIAGTTSNDKPENSEEIIKNLDQNFSKNLQNSDENYELLAENSGLLPGSYFPKFSENLIFETIPGEILTYELNTNQLASGRFFISYKIVKNNLLNIDPFRSEKNELFRKKVSKYVRGNWRFEDRQGYEIIKSKTGDYLITTRLYKENDENCCPTMQIEYKTKDFKNFVPLRIAELTDITEKPKWKTIN